MNLIDLGWNQEFEDKFSQINLRKNFKIARVAVEYKRMYKLYTERGWNSNSYN